MRKISLVVTLSSRVVTVARCTSGYSPESKPSWTRINQLKQDLLERAEAALNDSVQPAYEKLITFLKEQEQRATTDDGIWKWPDGEAYYANALERTTTTDLTAEEIHQIGLKEVARIHDEMRDIMKQVGFEGDLQDFFQFMREDEQFYYPNTDEGKQAYMDSATTIINTMRASTQTSYLS